MISLYTIFLVSSVDIPWLSSIRIGVVQNELPLCPELLADLLPLVVQRDSIYRNSTFRSTEIPTEIQRI